MEQNILPFGETLRTLRGRAGITQAQLAKISGMNQASIAQLETGVIPNPTIETVQRLLAALGYAAVVEQVERGEANGIPPVR
jgi:transcriptional regulator with XRE-family HTH domain